jgi:polyphenol oxidase
MIRKKKGDIEWLEFELFADHPKLVHGVFLRRGGVSQAPYDSLNAIKEVGDDLERVQENRKRIQEAFRLEGLIGAYHIHETSIEWIKEPREEIGEKDGMMTSSCKGWGLLALHADCQAAIFYDPVHHAVAAVHAGWRGQVKNIYSQTVSQMEEAFHSRPEDLLVAISPSLGPQNSEFKNFQAELPEKFWSFQIKPTYFDLWSIARYQLQECGLLPHHIQIACIDTYANEQDFFSYRREKARGRQDKITGAHATVAALL